MQHTRARGLAAALTSLGIIGAGGFLAGAEATTGSTVTTFNFPLATATDSHGTVYVADPLSGVVDKVSTAHRVTVFARGLRFPDGVAVDSAGNVYVATSKTVEEITPAGESRVLAQGFKQAAGLAVDSAGDVYVADATANEVKEIAPDGTVSVVVGTGKDDAPSPGPAAQSPLSEPIGVALDGAGNLYIADSGNYEIEKVATDGTLSIIAGVHNKAGTPTPGPATQSRLDGMEGVAADPAGDVYVAMVPGDTYSDSFAAGVLKIDTSGNLSVVAGSIASRREPQVVVSGRATAQPIFAGVPSLNSAGDLFVPDLFDGVIEKVTPAGHMSLYAGKGQIQTLSKPRIKGTYVVGRTLHVSKGGWFAPQVTEHVQWYAAGRRIRGATADHLKLTGALRHKRIVVRVKVAKRGYVTRTVKVTGKKVA